MQIKSHQLEVNEQGNHLFHDLWSHPAGGADEGVSGAVTWQNSPRRDERAHSQVGQHHRAVVSQQYVASLHVPAQAGVGNTFRVNET